MINSKTAAALLPGVLLLSLCQSVVASGAAASGLDQDALSRKQWYLRKIVVADTELPVSYATVIVTFYLFYYLSKALRGGPPKPVSYCVAWHILLKDHGHEAAQQLTQYRDKIQSNPEAFAKYAKKYSACPSSFNKGSLGKFVPGSMDPHFESVCFDPQAPLQTTIGPVHSRFGFHLIWIEERKLVKT